MRKFFFFFLLLPILNSCSSVDKIKGASKAETAYLRGEYYLSKERYDDALEKFNVVKNQYPYSPFAVPAELKIADSYYKKGDFFDSNRLYIKFAELHPESNDRGYAIYMSALSLYDVLPSSIDKDISVADKAIELFQKYISLYPGAEYYELSQKKYSELRTKQANRIKYIADFYKKRDEYGAALNRYLVLYNEFTDIDLDEELLKNIHYCYKKLKDSENTEIFKNIIKEKFPKSNN